MSNEASTRERLIAAMSDALQQRGLHGVGLAELLARAQAPKGVLYHHFPGGKTQLAVAAIDAAAARVCAALDQVVARRAPVVESLRQWLDGARRVLVTSGFERGCPLATVALESTADDTALREALARGFDAIRTRLAAAFAAAGVDAAPSRSLAALVVATYEGALMQSRVAGSAAPMTAATAALLRLIETQLPNPGAHR